MAAEASTENNENISEHDIATSKKLEVALKQYDLQTKKAETAFKELRKAHVELQNQREVLARLRNEYTELSWIHFETVSSLSWRLSWPFRAVYSFLKKKIINKTPKSHSKVFLNPEQERLVKQGFWFNEKPGSDDFMPLVSVIVPNYNHAAFLRERLESIYNQSYSNFEVILLDDCSSDDSRDILNEYAQTYSNNTRICFNDENSGSVFSQWDKGMAMANGSLIWVAESDDYCLLDFLQELVPAFEHEATMLAFARSVFMQNGDITWSTEEYLADLPKLSWSAPFTMSAHEAVNRGFALKNIIPNVSSALFRNIGALPTNMRKQAANMRLSGDWLFYLTIIQGGCIHYTNKTINFYRIHGESTSLKTQVTQAYYSEFEEVSKYVAKLYRVDDAVWSQSLENLKKHYKAMQKTDEGIERVDEWYNIENIKKEAAKRKLNIGMACFSLQLGGGEIYPLHLANEMKKQGYSITVFDFGFGKNNPKVRTMLNPSIPLVHIENRFLITKNLAFMGIEIIHSHHGSVDGIIAQTLELEHTSKATDEFSQSLAKCTQVITLHGMYEAIEEKDLLPLIDLTDKSCPKFVYIADKNLTPFEKNPNFTSDRFVKLPNGLPKTEIMPINRKDLGIPDDAFVACLASRGIPEKGWAEAVEIVTLANAKSKRPVHLLLLGDGEMKDVLAKTAPEFVHLIGMVSNTRNYYSISDIGLFPTRFKGESYPLVVIEALQCNKPIIASNIAEIKNQLTTPDGKLAGKLFNLNNWAVPIEEAAALVAQLANNPGEYNLLVSHCEKAAEKFDISSVVKQYYSVYEDVAQKQP